MKRLIRIATRKSPLALAQANIVKKILEGTNGFAAVQLVPMITTGDTASIETFKNQGGKGLFLKELEQALVKNDADIAVHSLKDVPTRLDKKFSLLTIDKRIDPSDVFVSDKFKSIHNLPSGSVVGTSSPRRIALLKASSKNISVKTIRGNIQTRIDKLKNEKLDGIILASAGILRLSLGSRISEKLPTDKFIPSAGQGTLCVEYMTKNIVLAKILLNLVNKDTQLCADAERSFVDRIKGDCMSPIGVNAKTKDETIIINAIVSDYQGNSFIRLKLVDAKVNAKSAGKRLADIFIRHGARKLLRVTKT